MIKEKVPGTVVEIVVFVLVAVVEVVLGGETETWRKLLYKKCLIYCTKHHDFFFRLRPAFWVLAMVRVPCLSLTGKSTFAFSPSWKTFVMYMPMHAMP